MHKKVKFSLAILGISICLQLAIFSFPVTVSAQQVPTSTSPLLTPQGLDVVGSTEKNTFGQPEHSPYGAYIRVLVKNVESTTNGSNSTSQIYKYTVEILDGTWKGKTITFSQKPNTGPTALKPESGERLVAFAEPSPNSPDPTIIFEHHDRTPAYITLIVTLFLVLLAIAGRRGLTIAFSIFAGYASIIWVLSPLITRGWSTPMAIAATALTFTLPTLWAGLGWNKKMVAAACSSLGGVAVTYLVIEIFASWTHLAGPANEMTSTFFETYPSLNIRVLLVSGAMITALAVIQDVATAIASGIAELKKISPSSDLKDLFAGGMQMGRDHLVTMAPILLLASLGVSLAAWMVDLQTEAPWLHTLNAETMAQSLILPLSGILGLALTIPLSSICTSLFWTRSFRKLDPLRRAVSWRNEIPEHLTDTEPNP